eukprot:15477728-Alexandrium_andersonii.AAC.1
MRGHIRIEDKLPVWAKLQPGRDEGEAVDGHGVPLHSKSLLAVRALRQCAAVANASRPSRADEWSVELVRQFEAARRRVQGVVGDSARLDPITPHSTPWPRIVVACKLAIRDLQDHVTRAREAAKCARRSQFSQALQASTGLSLAFKVLQPKRAVRINVMQADQGLTSVPAEMDAAVRAAWDPISTAILRIPLL